MKKRGPCIECGHSTVNRIEVTANEGGPFREEFVCPNCESLMEETFEE